MLALMSILTMYKYDNTLFDGLTVPDGLDKTGLINELCMQLAEVNTIISNPDVMKLAITEWSKTRSAIWEHLFETTQYEYNPIWNKDGSYTETETRNLKTTDNGTQTRDLTGTADSTVTGDRTAFNSDTYEPVDRGTSKGSSTDKGNIKSDNEKNDTGTVTRVRTEKGNIGVTTTQQMIREEREIADWSLYQVIIDEFKMRFCIMVY